VALLAHAGAGLTASYNDGYESEVVTTDASVFALHITGGQPGSRTDGTALIKACTTLSPMTTGSANPQPDAHRAAHSLMSALQCSPFEVRLQAVCHAPT